MHAMQGKHLFEYAIVRIVPRMERGEMINAGVALYCRNPQFIGMRFALDAGRLAAFSPATDIEEVRRHLRSMSAICVAAAGSGPIGLLEAASRFRWLTATRSTVVQCSAVHPGLCDDNPEITLEALFEEMVG